MSAERKRETSRSQRPDGLEMVPMVEALAPEKDKGEALMGGARPSKNRKAGWRRLRVLWLIQQMLSSHWLSSILQGRRLQNGESGSRPETHHFLPTGGRSQM